MLPGLIAVALFAAAPAFGWEHWGGDRGGTRFSPLAQITPANVGNLVPGRFAPCSTTPRASDMRISSPADRVVLAAFGDPRLGSVASFRTTRR